MKSATTLISYCEAFAAHGYHSSSITITRDPSRAWTLRIIFADMIAHGTPNAELSEVPEFGEDSVPGGYFVPGVHRAGRVPGFEGVTMSGWTRVPDYVLALDWAAESIEQAEAIIAQLAGEADSIDWATFRREDGQVSCLTKPGRWLTGMHAALHANAEARAKKMRNK